MENNFAFNFFITLSVIENSNVTKILEFTSHALYMLMQDLTNIIKLHKGVIPKSRFRRNIKSYWCQKLTILKEVKLVAFRVWVDAGRPRESNIPLFEANKPAKKNFRKRLKQASKAYDKTKIKEAVEKAELDHTTFWKLLKREKDGPCVQTSSIKNPAGKVVHNVEEILGVCKTTLLY